MDPQSRRERFEALAPGLNEPLPPVDPSRAARLWEDTMTDDPSSTSRATRSRTDTRGSGTGTRGRGPLTWLLAAAAVLLIAGVGVFGVAMLANDQRAPRAEGRPTVTELRAPAAPAYAARCLPPSARTVARQSIAFEGTVDDITAGRVTLTPTRWYHGTPVDEVTIDAPAPQLADLIGAARFEVGQSYLVSATDGEVTVCGLTAPYSEALAALYAEAFPG
ncbi:MAG TPA: hypothetical protein VGP00_01725 [Nocardioides sp.]|nr:hypothetical protein [Nocardioides sp.]